MSLWKRPLTSQRLISKISVAVPVAMVNLDGSRSHLMPRAQCYHSLRSGPWLGRTKAPMCRSHSHRSVASPQLLFHTIMVTVFIGGLNRKIYVKRIFFTE